MNKGIAHILAIVVVLAIGIAAILYLSLSSSQPATESMVKIPAPSPTPIAHYNPPVIKPSEAYTIIFVGDSMIDNLGENFDYLRDELDNSFPDKVFGLFNYGYGSTNIETLPERLNSKTVYNGRENEAILDRVTDIIMIGSFGHNPLSDLTIEEGLARQIQVLDQAVLDIATRSPNTLIVFIADFAPSRDHYAEGLVDLSAEQRGIWVAERKAYIEGHIEYAKSHNIPLINIYEESMVNGDVNLDYISKDSYIHPSTNGVIFMSQKIAEFLINHLP